MTEQTPLAARTTARLAIPFLIVTLIWGSTWTVIRTQLHGAPIGWSVTYRFVIAGVTMLGVALWRGDRLRIGARDHLFLAPMGLAIFCGNFSLVYRAEQHVTSGLVAVVFSLLVAYNSILAWLVFGQRPSRPFLIGTGVAMLGVILLFAHELRATDGDPHQIALGIGLTLLALACASVANVMQSAARAKALPMATLLTWSLFWGALGDALLAWTTSGPPVLPADPLYIGGALYLGVIASAFAFTLYYGLIREMGPARAGYINVIVPVIAMAFSTVLEDYRWSPETIGGGMLVLLGLVVAMSARRPAR